MNPAFVGRVWRAAERGVPLGAIMIFLPDRTLLMDSCFETYRVSKWGVAGDRIRWLEDTVPIEAEVVTPSKDELTLKIAGQNREQHYIATILSCQADLIVLAGFMRVLKMPFLSKFEGKIINLHPSLLPSFPGLDGIGQAFRRGVKITGCTVHYVTLDVDGGPIIDQAAVRIETNDTLDSLAAKVHAAEHALLPAVIARLSEAGTSARPA